MFVTAAGCGRKLKSNLVSFEPKDNLRHIFTSLSYSPVEAMYAESYEKFANLTGFASSVFHIMSGASWVEYR